MDSKPLITYSGDKKLFESLESGIIQGLPSDSIEWRRSYGRPPKNVCVEAQFIPFTDDITLNTSEQTLMGQPFLHTYWTDCVDVDQYRATVKENISVWLSKLRGKNSEDWIVILVENMDSRRGGKPKLLPRASVLNKIKSDFCGKQQDRCIALLDPLKSDTRGAESWQGLFERLRNLLLQAYNRYLSRFEENMRSQRERRNEEGWSFCQYFLLQEELAFVFEMLGIYDEALVQYDELDALFTQFVINSNSGDTPEWLSAFSQSCNCWEGLSLSRAASQEKQKLLREGSASLLDLRNYLFSRQCALLLFMFRPWEVAQRSLTFMHSCINELQILEVKMPPGAVACWVFLSCLEVLQTCEKFNDTSHVESFSRYTAGLWSYARSKLQDLGTMCGLMPDMVTTSEQLLNVVELLSGMGAEQQPSDSSSPMAKLREALSSKETFQRLYLELSELAMGTFKHIGRIRSARLIGIDLAVFYMKLNEPHKAAAFLSDALKTFHEDKWPTLVLETQVEIIKCFEIMEDHHKFIKMAIQLACNPTLSDATKVDYFNQLKLKYPLLEESSEKLVLYMDDAFSVTSIELVTTKDDQVLTVDNEVYVKLYIRSKLPKPLTCDTVIAALVCDADVDAENICSGERRSRNNSNSKYDQDNTMSISSSPLDLSQDVVYNEDQSTYVARIRCDNSQTVLQRHDSQNRLHSDRDISAKDFNLSLTASDIVLHPGDNEVVVSSKAECKGEYSITQLIIRSGPLEFVLPKINPSFSYPVVFEPPTVTMIRQGEGAFVAGIQQEMLLTVYTGSKPLESGTAITLRGSEGILLLEAQTDSNLPQCLQPEIQCTIPSSPAFTLVSVVIKVLAEIGSHKDASTIRSKSERGSNNEPPSIAEKVTIKCPLVEEPVMIDLYFVPPFITMHRLHTANTRKFVQLSVNGLNMEEFELKGHSLSVAECPEVIAVPLNAPDQQLVVRNNLIAWYVWEIVSNLIECPSLQLEFTFNYRLRPKNASTRPSEFSKYVYKFSLGEYKTLFNIQARVEPKGSEFCQARSMCHMHIEIARVNQSPCKSLMYEVVADQTSWAVCGRTAGVVNMEECTKQNVVLDVMPLTSGFLPLPTVRLSKYIPAEQKQPAIQVAVDSPKRIEPGSGPGGGSRLEYFLPGQVYNSSEAAQIQVSLAPSANALTAPEITVN